MIKSEENPSSKPKPKLRRHPPTPPITICNSRSHIIPCSCLKQTANDMSTLALKRHNIDDRELIKLSIYTNIKMLSKLLKLIFQLQPLNDCFGGVSVVEGKRIESFLQLIFNLPRSFNNIISSLSVTNAHVKLNKKVWPDENVLNLIFHRSNKNITFRKSSHTDEQILKSFVIKKIMQ